MCAGCFKCCNECGLNQKDFTNWSKSTCPYNGPNGVYMTVTEADKMYDDDANGDDEYDDDANGEYEYDEYGGGYDDGIKDSSGW